MLVYPCTCDEKKPRTHRQKNGDTVLYCKHCPNCGLQSEWADHKYLVFNWNMTVYRDWQDKLTHMKEVELRDKLKYVDPMLYVRIRKE